MESIRINTAAPSPPQSSVLIIYTGGTFGMTYDEEGKHLKPFDFSGILSAMPELAQLSCEITVYSLPRLIDSSNMDPAIWLDIARLIGEQYAHYDGFVILHGTDTMAYTASALSFLLEHLNKPVILTGAQLPVGAIRTDARGNLVSSIQIAEAKHQGKAVVPEVAVFFNDHLLRGNRAKKEESAHFDAFQSENYPHLAKVGINIQYNWAYLMSSDTSQNLKVYEKMSREVALIKLYPGIQEKTLRAQLEISDLEGLVLESYGAGNAPTQKWFLKALEEAICRGVQVLNVSQCIGGQVLQGRYETSVALKEMGVISGYDLSTEAAITKLMFVLGQKKGSEEVYQQLNTSLRGEMSIPSINF